MSTGSQQRSRHSKNGAAAICVISAGGRGALRLRNRPTVVLEGDGVGLWPAANSGVERVDRDHVFPSELEVEDVEVLGDACRLGRFRNRSTAALQVPSKHHLGG